MKTFLTTTLLITVLTASPVYAGTLSPGHEKQIQKNGSPRGEVTGGFKGYKAYDATGAYYWDVRGSVVEGSVINSQTDLDLTTLTECFYTVNFRGFLNFDSGELWGGWFTNSVRCKGYDYPDGQVNYHFRFVDQYDKRFDGDVERVIFEDISEESLNVWEYTDMSNSNLSTEEMEGLVIFPVRR